jgi:hypothetical protein
VTTKVPGLLHIVAENDAPLRRLGVARRHIETAIAHINDVAQARVLEPALSSEAVDELRLLVRALADIREALRGCEWPTPMRQANQPETALAD